jgi:hypothetical protein
LTKITSIAILSACPLIGAFFMKFNLKKLLTGIVISLLALGAVNSVVFADPPLKVTVCHLTASDKNPWVVQEINANELQSHLDNGDFLIDATHPCPPQSQVTPTPTVTQGTPTPTSTPTPTTDPGGSASIGGQGDGKSDGLSSCPDCTKAHNNNNPSQVVLGASTMAGTGTFETTMMNIMLGFGMLFLGVGSKLYAQSKKS